MVVVRSSVLARGAAWPAPAALERLHLMNIELCCPGCHSQFNAPAHLATDTILGRMQEAGLPFSLAKGASFQDMVRATLIQRGYIGCPDCGSAVAIHERRRGHSAPARPAWRKQSTPVAV
jgi:hypothetical protein